MNISERLQAKGPSKARLPAKEPGRAEEQRSGRSSGNRERHGVAGQPIGPSRPEEGVWCRWIRF